MSSQYKWQSILIFKLSIQKNTLYSKNEDKRKNTLFTIMSSFTHLAGNRSPRCLMSSSADDSHVKECSVWMYSYNY